jgi:hypothetical protein
MLSPTSGTDPDEQNGKSFRREITLVDQEQSLRIENPEGFYFIARLAEPVITKPT